MASTTSPTRLLSSSVRRGDSLSYLSPSSGSDNSFVTPPMSPLANTPSSAAAAAVARTAAPTGSPLTGAASAAGIMTTPKGERVIPASARKDGSMRKEIRIRPGFVPTEDVPRYNVAERVHSRRQRLAREKEFGEQDVDVERDVDDASNVLEGLVIDERGFAAAAAAAAAGGAAKTGSGEQDALGQVGRPAVTPATATAVVEPLRIAPTRQPKNAPADRSFGWSRSNSADSTASQESKDTSRKPVTDSYLTPRPTAESKATKTVDREPYTNEFTAWDAPTSSPTKNASGWDLPKSSGVGGWGCSTSESEWTSTFTATDSVVTTGTERSGKPDQAEGFNRGRSRWKNDNHDDDGEVPDLAPVDNTPDSRSRVPGRRYGGRDGDYSSSHGPSSDMMWIDPSGTGTAEDKGPRRVDPDRRGRSPEERKRALEEFLNRPLQMKQNYPSFNEFVVSRGGGRTSSRVGSWMPSSENDKGPAEVSGHSGVLASRYAH
ncbi:hypothetical protein V1525DRAFT_406107 [Lipomyces kononenkoae]|uniref:Uncharacterized protein n=1 Tax=Lipomyces kononenkoae TaxID=34357 RepID=A0ACC3SZ72_LIPKO